jgi:O-antigen/teichoic acid export membrane protein
MLKKLASETAIYGVSSILSRLLNYVILTPYLTNVFLKGQYGVVTDMYVYAGLLMVLFTYRMETTFFRFGNDPSQREKVFSTTAWSLIGTTVLFVAILLLLAQPLANWLKYPDHPDYVIWFIFIIAFDALSVIPFARLRLENRPVRFAVLKTLGIIINILFIFLFLEGAPWFIQQGVSGLSEYFTVLGSVLFL